MDKEVLYAFVRTLLALPLVLVLAYLLIKYGIARRGTVYTGGHRRRMRVVEQMPLGAKGWLSLVEVGGRYYLLAHSENGFTLVKEYDSLPEVIERGGLNHSLPSFHQILKGKLKPGAGRTRKEETEGDNGREG
ncbi:flagellar protein FliO/FliZ [Desulfohalotomaculum tongense]|uniref:FliO/MopB family protein n=1 Tax=Desulforadius tongensis TaxID=1216062 RepID=UPI0019596EC6|nr:flagellar biosynthetic protein FliO [Desulforadius tongensis]MBM7854220.1 flagellar protein FliO/FliZ [Desulforadius tongensis]